MKNKIKIQIQITILAVILLMSYSITPATPSEGFNKFCLDNFGALKDSLYNPTNAPLDFNTEGFWVYPSRNSICFGWSTNLPARGAVIIGISDNELNDTLKRSTRYHYNHLVYANNLLAEKAYYYKFICEEEDGTIITSEVKMIETKKLSDAKLLPTAGLTFPISLSEPNATYILTQDIVADGSAIYIKANNITLDLNGYSITYDNKKGTRDSTLSQDEFGYYGIQGNHAIMNSYGGGNVKVYNGSIIQAEGNGIENSKPIHISKSWGEMGGVSITYDAPETIGIGGGGVQHLHHNVIEDNGTVIIDRHLGLACIQGGENVHNNLITRTRHRGIDAEDNSIIRNNEIYIDSWATNSYGISYYNTKSGNCTDNYIFGTGYMAHGIGTVSSASDINVHRNFVHLIAGEPNDRSSEYGDFSGAYCARVTWGGVNLQYHENTFISEARDGGIARGIWFCPDANQKNNVFMNNTVKTIITNDMSDKRGAVVISGIENPPDSTVLFIGNRIISNFCNVLLGEDYGYGSGALFLNNTFVRLPLPGSRYRTIQCGFWNKRNAGSIFINSKFENGAGYSNTMWEGTGERNFMIGWSLTIFTGENTDISIKNAKGEIVFNSNTKQNDSLIAHLHQYVALPSGNIAETPHLVIATKNGITEEKTVVMDTIRTISLFNEPTSMHLENSFPNEFELNQNYPNPFNPITKISYSLPANGLVKLLVFDVLGNEITSLVDEYKNGGYHNVEFDASNLSSGIYFYQLNSGKNTVAKKLMLMK